LYSSAFAVEEGGHGLSYNKSVPVENGHQNGGFLMKKTVLSLAGIVLAIGLLAGCSNANAVDFEKAAAPLPPTVTKCDNGVIVSFTGVAGATSYSVYYKVVGQENSIATASAYNTIKYWKQDNGSYTSGTNDDTTKWYTTLSKMTTSYGYTSGSLIAGKTYQFGVAVRGTETPGTEQSEVSWNLTDTVTY
jgi:hypothetical protein